MKKGVVINVTKKNYYNHETLPTLRFIMAHQNTQMFMFFDILIRHHTKESMY